MPNKLGSSVFHQGLVYCFDMANSKMYISYLCVSQILSLYDFNFLSYQNYTSLTTIFSELLPKVYMPKLTKSKDETELFSEQLIKFTHWGENNIPYSPDPE